MFERSRASAGDQLPLGASAGWGGLLEQVPGRLVVLLLLPVLIAGCSREAPVSPASVAGWRARFVKVMAVKDPHERARELEVLDGTVQPATGASRGARRLSLTLANALAQAWRAARDEQARERWYGEKRRREQDYLAADPADGALLGFVVEQEVVRGDLAAACRLLEGAGGRVDLDTAEELVRRASSVDSLRHVKPDPERLGSRTFERLCAELRERVLADEGRPDLLEQVTCAQALTLLGLGEVDRARGLAAELERAGLQGARYFQLRSALSGVPSKAP